MKNLEVRVRRLEIAVIALALAFVLSICVSAYGFLQITALSNKIPDYKELKSDIKMIKKLSKDLAPVVKNKVVDGYKYTKDKASDIVDYFKGN
jgi:hypothetical protein